MFKKRVAAMLAMMLAFSVPAVSVFAAEQSLKLEQEVNDGRLEILEEGTYVLTGEMQGTIFVDPGEGDVELILDGVDIDGGASAGIIVTSGDSLKITLPDKTISRVTGGSEENPYRAAIYSEVPTTFEGNGSLYVNSADAYGIRTKDADLTFNGGSFAIKAQVDGMIADGRNAGVLTLNEDAHFSIQAWNEVAPKTNYVQNGAMIELVAPDNANLTTQVPFLPEKLGGMSAPDGQMPAMDGEMPAMDGQMPMMDGEMSMMDGQMPAMDGTTLQGTSDTASEIVSGTVTNSAANLEADYDNATYISVTDDESQVVITSSGTYVVTGSSSDGNITVKKGTTGVVLVLDNLDLTSTTGATVSINKEAEVKIIISGNVVLTDNENPDDENSTDEEVADAFDGAALKAKANSQVYVTGDGTLTINGNAKNGIKGGDESSLIFDGVTVNINAVNDGINGNYDVTLLSGTFTIAAGDDAIHADHILTIGSEDGTGPVINVTSSTEGLEATVINVYGGNISVVSSDDAINAANGDGLYEGELDYSFNMMGGSLVIRSQGDGIDSNGNINLIGGTAQINSASAGGEAGIDYDGDLYVSDSYSLNNGSGVAGPDGMGGMPGQSDMGSMPGQSDMGSLVTPDGMTGLPEQNAADSIFGQNTANGAPNQNSTNGTTGQNTMNGMPGQSSTTTMPGQNSTMTMPGQNSTMTMPGQNNVPVF